VHSEDGEEVWIVPTVDEVQYLERFVKGDYKGYPASKKWMAKHGLRFGLGQKGVYVQTSKWTRFFGLPRHLLPPLDPTPPQSPRPSPAKPASASPAKNASDPIAEKTGDFLIKLEHQVGTISDDMRERVLRSTFESADTSGDGRLNREELSAMIRKIVPSMSGHDVMLLFDQADTNRNKTIDYHEFVDWLRMKAPTGVSDRFKLAMSCESDIVRFGFRIWDKDGNGTVSRRELSSVLRETCPQMTTKQIEALLTVIDTNRDGQIDFNEFVDFLYSSK
jgi:Ca2+-binding EF-hand superfamily protein